MLKALNDRYVFPDVAKEMETYKADEPEWKSFLQDCLKEFENNKPVLKPVTFELKGFDNADEVYVAGSFKWFATASQKLED